MAWELPCVRLAWPPHACSHRAATASAAEQTLPVCGCWFAVTGLITHYDTAMLGALADPPDTVKARLQVQGAGGAGVLYRGTLDAFAKIAAREVRFCCGPLWLAPRRDMRVWLLHPQWHGVAGTPCWARHAVLAPGLACPCPFCRRC